MGNLFRSPATVNQPAPPAAALRVQASVQGKARVIGWGKTRIAGNLIWYGDFKSYAVQTASGGGGGGGKGLGGGNTQNVSTTYQYTAAVAIALCEGPISAVGTIWNNKSKVTAASSIPGPFDILAWASTGGAKTNLGFTLFSGSYSQSPWGYLVSLHPTQALNYRGDAYMAAGPLQLGETPELPNFSFEVTFAVNGAYTGTSDANPKNVISDFLTNQFYGLGFPGARLDANTTYSNYCIASGLVFSPVVADQKSASDHLKDWMMATNSEFVWSAGTLKVIPYGDQNLTANGATYTAPTNPVYALTDNDFMPGSGGNTEAPVTVTRSRIEDQSNSIQIEYLDATNDYNPTIIEVKDDAGIQVYGLRKQAVTQLHQFTQQAAAIMSASLQLGRQQILNTFTFTVQGAFILLDPMDIITVFDTGLSSSALAVRIKEISENEDYSLTIVAEEYLAGTGSSPLYGAQPNTGHVPNYNASPGNVLAPVLFEPTDQLAGGLFVWGAVTGADLSVWGGCEVWASWDDTTYKKLPGTMNGPSRMGVTTNTLPSFAQPAQGAAIDTTNTLSIDLTESQGAVTSSTTTDNLLFGSLMWLDGELLSFQNATPTGTYSFNLTTLNRGGYGTASNNHASASALCRVDQGIFQVPFTQERIGATLYLKFLSYNKFGGGKQGLEDVGAYTYLVVGTALSSPLPDVQNFVFSYVGDITYMDWDIVDDFRSPILYEIRKGVSWDGGQTVGTYAHPHVPAFGDATYWIRAVCQPAPGLLVYSEDAEQLGINGSVIPQNLLASYDEGPTGSLWPGTITGSASFDGTFIFTIKGLGSITDFLAVPDVTALADKLSVGSGGIGYYTIPDSHIVSAGRLAPCLVQIIWGATGSGSGDFFNPGPPDNNDVFAHSDIFDSNSNRFIDVHPEIALSTDGVNFGPWQRYQAGFYNLWKVKARMRLESLDPTNISAFLTAFQFIVYATTRTDHPLVNALLSAAGQTVTFQPDNTVTAAAFNGGPNGGTINPSPGVILPAASLPGTQAIVVNPTAGDQVFITALSLSSLFVQVKNAGVGVSRNLTLQVWGF